MGKKQYNRLPVQQRLDVKNQHRFPRHYLGLTLGLELRLEFGLGLGLGLGLG